MAAKPNRTEKIALACSCGDTLRYHGIDNARSDPFLELWDSLHSHHAEVSMVRAQTIRRAYSERMRVREEIANRLRIDL